MGRRKKGKFRLRFPQWDKHKVPAWILIDGDAYPPVSIDDVCWVPISVAAALFGVSIQTIHLIIRAEPIRVVKWKGIRAYLIFLPDLRRLYRGES